MFLKKQLLSFLYLLSFSAILFASKDIKIGVYSGTFDPPTLAHNHVIRKTIDFLNLDKLFIFVNKNGEKNYKCSAHQRVEMLKVMLADIADKVVIIDQCSDKKYHDYLLLKKCINQPIVMITGYDSYARRLLISEDIRINFDQIAIIPRFGEMDETITLEPTAFMLPLDESILKNVSSTKVRKQLAEKIFHGIDLHPATLSYVISNSLYLMNNELEKEYERSFFEYVGKKVWNINVPPFDPQCSPDSWNENFYKWVLFNKIKAS